MDKCCLFVYLYFTDIVITEKTEMNLNSLTLCVFVSLKFFRPTEKYRDGTPHTPVFMLQCKE